MLPTVLAPAGTARCFTLLAPNRLCGYALPDAIHAVKYQGEPLLLFLSSPTARRVALRLPPPEG